VVAEKSDDRESPRLSPAADERGGADGGKNASGMEECPLPKKGAGRGKTKRGEI